MSERYCRLWLVFGEFEDAIWRVGRGRAWRPTQSLASRGDTRKTQSPLAGGEAPVSESRPPGVATGSVPVARPEARGRTSRSTLPSRRSARRRCRRRRQRPGMTNEADPGPFFILPTIYWASTNDLWSEEICRDRSKRFEPMIDSAESFRFVTLCPNLLWVLTGKPHERVGPMIE